MKGEKGRSELFKPWLGFHSMSMGKGEGWLGCDVPVWWRLTEDDGGRSLLLEGCPVGLV